MTESNGAAVQIAAPTDPTDPRPDRSRPLTTDSTVGLRPTVIVDNLHVTYRVFASGRPAGSKDNQHRFL